MNTITRTRTVCFLLAVAAAGVATSWAATPPVWVNYQGVLRDSADNPLDGTHDMVFRFYSGLDEEILIDRHTTAQGGAVTVSGGLFSVALGTGSTADGSGPGTYGSLVEVFRDYNEVHLEVQIGADGAQGTEVLSPRTRVISAAYALNASNLAGLPATSLLRSNESDAYTFGTLSFSPGTTLDLGGTLNMDGAVTKVTTDHVANFNADLLDNMDSSAFSLMGHGHTGGEITGPVGEAGNADTLDGHDSSYFLNTSTATQSKAGPLIVDTAGAGFTAFEALGDGIGGFFSTMTGTGFANVAKGNRGIEALGTEVGGYFKDSDESGEAYVGYADWGINAAGDHGGGYFSDSDGSALASLAVSHSGIDARGNEAGGHFWNRGGTGEALLGYLNPITSLEYGVWAKGAFTGGYFRDAEESGYAYAGYGDRGVHAAGTEMGGYFFDSDGSGFVNAGVGDVGIDAHGDLAGGHFRDRDGTSETDVAYGHYGIDARGNITGGYFVDQDSSGRTYVGFGDFGIDARGDTAGGLFVDTNSTGWAYVGYLDEGISAHGSVQGGYFEDTDGTSYAHVAYGNYGIESGGTAAGGRFLNSSYGSLALVAFEDVGINAEGSGAGGYFHDTDSTAWARTADDYSGITYKIRGNGQVSFVQNHPEDENRVLVYTAPEGDETAVYTRGTARIVDGEARVALGETFKWVANPDVGLTAHLTPRDEPVPLAVVDLTPEEIVVRAPAGYPDGIVFDYLVYGLRIGFERSEVIQIKEQEALLPETRDDEDPYSTPAAAGAATALERFVRMTSEVRDLPESAVGLAGARELRQRIVASGWQGLRFGEESGIEERAQRSQSGAGGERPREVRPEEPPLRGSGGETYVEARISGISETLSESREGATPGAMPWPSMPVSEPVETGDLVVLDREQPGRLCRSSIAADPGVIGIVAEGELNVAADGLRAPVAVYGLATVKVDASYGAILTGDLLTSSPTSGHAMRAVAPTPGTVIGKALEALESGTGSIRVLVMPR